MCLGITYEYILKLSIINKMSYLDTENITMAINIQNYVYSP